MWCRTLRAVRPRRVSVLLVSGLHEVGDRGVGRGQGLFIRQKYDAEMLGAFLLPEAGTVNHQHMLLHQQFFNKDSVVFRNVDPRECIEGSFGRNATDAWR